MIDLEKRLPREGTFSTRATSVKGLLSDLRTFILNLRKGQGTAPTTRGVTVPFKDLPDSGPMSEGLQGVLDEITDWSAEQKQREGGRALDTASEDVDNTYRQQRYEFISREEGIRSRAYDDVNGQPVRDGVPVKGKRTVGIGFNMDRPGAKEIYERATGLDNFEDVRNGRATVGPEHIRKIFDLTAREAEDFVANRFKDVDLPEHKRLALVSLAFNNPALIGPNLTGFVKNGQDKEAREEILFRSNRARNRGIAGRRYREAGMYAGPMDAKDVLPDFETYIAQATRTGTQVASL